MAVMKIRADAFVLRQKYRRSFSFSTRRDKEVRTRSAPAFASIRLMPSAPIPYTLKRRDRHRQTEIGAKSGQVERSRRLFLFAEAPRTRTSEEGRYYFIMIIISLFFSPWPLARLTSFIRYKRRAAVQDIFTRDGNGVGPLTVEKKIHF